jgi:hypothetical protein
MSEDKIAIENGSKDHTYFTISPRIVWALCRNPFDFALWQTVKDIAGDSKECFISSPDLAILAMMSVGQIDNSRKYLITVGLLEGEVRRDPGYPLPVWHLRVPDLWEKSTVWSVDHQTIRSRIDFKRQQQARIRAEREAKKAGAGDLSPSERVCFSPCERPPLPGEKPPLPSETKKIEKEEQKESLSATADSTHSRTAVTKKGDLLDGMLHFAAVASDPGVALEARILEYPTDVQETLRTLTELYFWPVGAIPGKPRSGKGGQYAAWINELRNINQIIGGYGKEALEATTAPCAGLSISRPAGITWCLAGEIGKIAKREQRKPAVVDTPLTRTLENFVPRKPTPRPAFLERQ